ncbi:hypothetical protein BURKHO8Y_270030 [Burkholderia sp. 8Y]|nr:hypothetical protein BURKHO8Y_270030 [Burkholderia sp. 8Y]
MAFCGLAPSKELSERRRGRAVGRAGSDSDAPSAAIFWLHMTSFSLCNVLIGYLLTNNFRAAGPLMFLVAAMALHFLVTSPWWLSWGAA